ncbi:MAG: outer membrane beta-barrel protein [Halomonas sp.]|nr:outer membrane beta-barrel protein [Halomonas sp.]
MCLRHWLVTTTTFATLGLTFLPLEATAEARAPAFLGTGAGIGNAASSSRETSLSTTLRESSSRPGLDDRQNVFKGFVGYAFSPYFAAEVFYAYLGRIRFEDNGEASSDFESNAYGMSAVGQVPIAPWLTAFAKAGVAKWDTGVEGNLEGISFDREGQTGTDPVYGIGAQFNLDPFLLRTEYEYYDFGEDYRVDTFTASAGFRF